MSPAKSKPALCDGERTKITKMSQHIIQDHAKLVYIRKYTLTDITDKEPAAWPLKKLQNVVRAQ